MKVSFTLTLTFVTVYKSRRFYYIHSKLKDFFFTLGQIGILLVHPSIIEQIPTGSDIKFL